MSNGQDNQGKPPGPGAPPRPAMPRVTAPQSAPLVPQVTPVQPAVARPPGVPPVSAPSRTGMPAVPPVSSPSRTGLPVAPPPGVAPQRPGVPPVAPAVARPAMPVITPVAPVVPPIAPAAPRPVAPPVAAPAVPAVGAGRPVVAPATARPPNVLVPAAPGVQVPPVAPVAAGVLVPPRPAAAPLVPPAPPMARPAGAPIAPPAPPMAVKPVVPVAAAAPKRIGPLPETGSVETITPQQAAGLRQFADGLQAMDYFEALGVPQTATPGDIKKAFYRESRTYHPDRFFHLPESQVKEDIGSIYKRMTEAYYVLRDDQKRKKYLADVTGPERKNKLRYTEATESELKAEARKTVEEEFGTNPKARPYFKTALAEFDKGNWSAAVSAFKTGLMYEPGNTRFKEKLAEAQKKFDDARKGSNSFMIK
jgi:hypothetical protein